MTNADQTAGLRACPFCGGTDLLVHRKDKAGLSGLRPSIQCMGCFGSICGDTDEDTVAKWNARAPSKAALLRKIEMLEHTIEAGQPYVDAVNARLATAERERDEALRELRIERDAHCKTGEWHLEAAADRDRLRAALQRIAAFDDKLACEKLEKIGSYSSFDEPGSVQIARQALAEKG